MNCSEVRQDLQLVVDGELAAPRAADVARHLETCPECRDRVERGRRFDALVRQRAGAEAAPAELRQALRARLATPPPRSPLVRVLGSPWTPRLAMAAVLALLIAVPWLWLPTRARAVAETAAEQHACHAGAPGDPLPPCCSAVQAGVGERLGEPSPGVRVPDLAAVGLAWRHATRCTFAPTPVHFLAYADAAGNRFSLYTTAHGTRQFQFLRPAASRTPVRRSVVLEPDAQHARQSLEVTMWERAGIVYTWVGPAGPVYEAGLGILQNAARNLPENGA